MAVAARTVLLAVVRPGGRTSFLDPGIGAGPRPAALHGEWSVIARCDAGLTLELAVPDDGSLRGVGRGDGTLADGVHLVVPRQACARASSEFRAGAAPSEEQGRRLAGEGELVAAATRGPVSAGVVRFPDGRGRAVVGVLAPGGARDVWSVDVASADGLQLIGVARRRDGSAEAWFRRADAEGGAIIGAATSDGRTWRALGPLPASPRD